jgi:hypothetical protein
LTHGVMVTLLILVQSFMVRIHMGQQGENYSVISPFFESLTDYISSTDHPDFILGSI